MRRFFKITLYGLGAMLLILVFVGIGFTLYYSAKYSGNYQLATAPPARLQSDGIVFRDLNKNGRLDVYEDARQPIENRVNDLLSKMNLAEKAGSMFISMAGMAPQGRLHEFPRIADPLSFFLPTSSDLVLRKKLTSVNLMSAPAVDIAQIANALQSLASRTRLGIPLTIASDPRHVFSFNPLASLPTAGFSEWPEPLGFAALGDTVLMQRFAQIAQQEYRAVGIRLALHPMADLATEPRWPRINGTFGEDAALASKMVTAYIKGFQGDSLNTNSVACMTKHFSGGGPQKAGLDPHFEYGKEQVYPGNNFRYHLIPFKAAIAAHTAQMMPYYGIPMNQSDENVGFSFNKKIITNILRKELGFNGVVCTDWGIITDKKLFGFKVFTSPGWGVEQLSPEERVLKALDAGVDQFGGESAPEIIISLVHSGKLSEKRIDESVRRILRDKFRLGLFEQPYVDISKVNKRIGRKENIALGKQIQGKAMVLLSNKDHALPLKKGLKIYVENLAPEVAAAYGTVVGDPSQADIAILRLQAPYQVHTKGAMSSFFHHDDLDFKGKEKEHILSILKSVPTIVDIYLDRPAVIPEIAQQCKGLIANFGAKDEVLLDVLFGRIQPQGNLPFELPSSMKAVREQMEDVPYDSKHPLFAFGFGLRY